MCGPHSKTTHSFFCSNIIKCMHMSACVGAGGRGESHVCISLNKLTFTRFFIQIFFFFPHQRIFVNFQPCCILAVVKYEETGSCEITQVLSQNWRDASGSFVGSARPGFSSLFNVFCAHSHENSHFPRHPTDALLFFFFVFILLVL